MNEGSFVQSSFDKYWHLEKDTKKKKVSMTSLHQNSHLFFLLKDYLRDRNQNKVEAMKKYQNKIISFFLYNIPYTTSRVISTDSYKCDNHLARYPMDIRGLKFGTHRRTQQIDGQNEACV